ncbi:HVA22-like protein k [Carica papaya]|uniref:HVA22-like protein k n=1 Tax=Carica papaya TaxID=3649 RepID=UPI000B8D108C|nr:HVA22-like protein k [Carica papaya]
MSILGSSVTNEVGLRLLLSPLGSNIVIRTACCTVGIGLPVYSTFKAIERKDPKEQQKWLIYWAAYGSFSLVEVFADKFLHWVPLYYHLKFAFLVWLQLPTIDGAKHLYDLHLRPFLSRHQARLDLLTGLAYGEMVKLIDAHQSEFQFARTLIVKITGSVDQILRGTGDSDQLRAHSTSDEGQTRTIMDVESDLDD